MNSSIFFVELTKQEIKSKCVAFESGEILFWVPEHLRKDQSYCYEIKCRVNYNSMEHSFEVVKYEKDFDEAKIYLCRFLVGDVTYFSAGQWKKLNNKWQFLLTDKVYRYEKRKDDRLLTYPHRQVYLKLQQFDVNPVTDNVVTLQKSGSVLEKLYQELNPDEFKGIIKLRVLDISTEGISFLIGRHEVDHFDYQDRELQLEFDGKIFPLQLKEILYQAAYLDLYSKNSSLIKMGATFSSGKELTDHINFYLQDDSLIRFDVKHGFEDFILRQLR